MLLTSDHTRWAVATSLAAVVAAAAYTVYATSTPYGPSGGSWPGLCFGIAGTACMLSAVFLSARKKFLLWRIGSAQRWMKLHVWLGLLAIPLILFHAGFSLGGPLTTWLMVMFAIVSLSGIYGLAVQQVIPRVMTLRVPMETPRSQIDHLSASLIVDAYEQVASVTGHLPEAAGEQAALAEEEKRNALRPGDWKQVRRLIPAMSPAEGSDTLRNFYLDTIRPYLHRKAFKPGVPPDFARLRFDAPGEWRAPVDRLAEICEESRQLAVQARLHSWLHSWLLMHAPLSFALLVLVAVHVYMALHY
ncbi:MAG: ferric reductase-like transmembrane domain-containing protein [Deltaproteobacteria bacterium]|nr:ferric reductase-like transmembrane domain-containing protein [Deltaproteobacteria bacterium]